MTKWRLLDLGVIEPYELDVTKEGLLIALKKNLIPNTLCFAISKRAAWLGPSSNIEREINLEYCRKEGIPIIRGFTGAGSVALNGDSLSYMLASMRQFSERDCMLKGIRSMGLDAYKSESNDVLIAGKKVVGTAGCMFPSGIYIAGGIISVDFSPDFCEKVLLTPPGLFADKKAKSHTEWVTTLKTQLGREVSYGEVIFAIKGAFEAELNAEFEMTTSFTEAEEQIRKGLKQKYRSESWLKRGKWSPVKDYWR